MRTSRRELFRAERCARIGWLRLLRCLVVSALVAVGVVVGAGRAVAAGSVTVVPSSGLHDGDTVSISGSGWVPNSIVGICEGVPQQPTDISECNNEVVPTTVGADGSGNINVMFHVMRVIYVPALGRTVDCAQSTEPCAIGVAEYNDIAGTAVTSALNFAPQPPQIDVKAPYQSEGNSGLTPFVFSVALSYPLTQTATVEWNTLPPDQTPSCTAQPGSDYLAASGTVTFAPGETAQSATVSVIGDTIDEGYECFGVSFHDPVNATVAGTGIVLATIVNDDFATLVPTGGSALKPKTGTATLPISINLTNPSTKTITAQWNTVFLTGASDVQATPGTDYTAASGTVTFTPGQTTQTVPITIGGGTLADPYKIFVVSFHNPSGAAMGGFWGLAFGFILNNTGQTQTTLNPATLPKRAITALTQQH